MTHVTFRKMNLKGSSWTLKSTKHTLEPFPTINVHEIFFITKNMYYNRLITKNYTITPCYPFDGINLAEAQAY